MNDERDDPARGRHSRQPEGRNPGPPEDRDTPPTARQQGPRSQGPPPGPPPGQGGAPQGPPPNQQPPQSGRPAGPPPGQGGAPQRPPQGPPAGQQGPQQGQPQRPGQQGPGQQGAGQQGPPPGPPPGQGPRAGDGAGRSRQGEQPQWPGEGAQSGPDTVRNGPSGQQRSGSAPESPQETTGAWTPSFDDDDDDGASGSRGDSAEGRKLDLPTSFAQQPPPPREQAGGRQAPPGAGQRPQPPQQPPNAQQPNPQQPPQQPGEQGTQQVGPQQRPGQQPTRQGPPPPPGGQQGTRQVPPTGRPPQDPGERPTANIPQTPGNARDGGSNRGSRGGAAAAGGVVGGVAGAAAAGGAAAAAGAGSGAAGGAAGAAGAAGGAGGSMREPELLTHESRAAGYNYYSDSSYSDGGRYDDYDDFDDGYSDGAYADGPYDDDPDGLFPDDEMSASKAKRKVIWRRIRRGCYVAAAAMLLLGIGTFAWGYTMWEVPNPEKIASETQQTITINYANGQEMTRVEPEGGGTTMIRDLRKEVAKPMLDATVAAEDASFYSNPGFSIRGIAGAVFNQFVGGQGGGSTLTQQYVKLALDQDEYSITRKVKEVVIAYKVTNQQSKDDILKAYMNTAYYGRGARGIHDAAEAYFGKLPSELNPSEAAVLAGMVQRPYDNDPRADKEQAQSRWEYVAGQMLANKFVSKAERDAMQLPETRPRDAWTSKGDGSSHLHVRKQVLAELEREGYDQQALSLGGYTITTNIDPNAQRAAEEAVQRTLQGQPQNLHTTLAAVEPKTGNVRAYYGGGDNVFFDYAGSPQPPGSSFKPFVAAAGLKKGYGLGETYDGSNNQMIAGTKFSNAEGSTCDDPKNCGVREAMNESVNTVFVNMAVRFGPPSVREAAIDAGIPAQFSGKPSLQNADGTIDSGIALGAYPVRTIDMASAYGTFANDGKRVQPRFVQKVENSVKSETFSSPPPQPAFDKDGEKSKNIAANVIESMLGVAEHSKLPLDRNRPVASKTGTHQFAETGDNQNAWMIGTTPQLSTAVGMLADENGKPVAVRDKTGKSFYGSGLPGDVWQEFMNAYHKNLPVEQFPKPTPIGQYQVKPPPPPPAPSTTAPPPTTSSLPPTTSSLPPTSSESETSESETESSRPGPGSGCGLFGCPGGGNDSPGGDDGGAGMPNGVAPTRGRDGE
ncbi:transglycosylase domain-containing protein [Saccharopolyspora sp. SCSIO 74807]|uniref:transglycosylase domain-containing protein n=1 Tax=Saccharopolyspora sp. SCSIO 74807 TaxID=3118084 RepID=UPI0030D0BC84